MVICFYLSGVYGQTCYRVTYTDRSICAFKGSSVDISCTYNSYYTYIRSKFWFRPERSHQWQNPSQPEDLSEDSQYAGRVQVLETERGRSTLRITDLRESDSAEYHFTFTAGSFEWRSSLPGTTLTVTDLQVQVIRSTVYKNYTEAELLCHSGCRLPDRPSYVWFKNGQKMESVETSSYKDQFYPGDIISCALKGHEDFPSPLVYAPKLPSVSLNSSTEILEANYTWYKENEDSPKASGQNFTITDLRAEHSGNYYCEAQNRRGRHNSTLHLIVVAGSMKSVAVVSITIFLALIFLCGFLLIRRKRSSKQTKESGERTDNTAQLNMGLLGNNPSAAAQRKQAEESDDLCYASVSFSKNQEDALYSNIKPAQPNRHKNEEEEDEDGVEYSVVNFKSASASAELRRQEALEDSSALYSAVSKNPRV
ncbi:B-cell receptor CD22-like [Micropterus dolomieu]|uniref:B-cell receptor CD22-like n=1 Tax=Micropterus dolomieu TaxID=147949 RepID=UPI001E8CC9D9|nr:B-cell receptor CD22-like [Micropterus dolomieu]